MDELPRTKLSLWRDDAIVLYDWLATVDYNALPISHPAQKQALVDLFNVIETDTDLPAEWSPEEVERAKAEVAKDMGW